MLEDVTKVLIIMLQTLGDLKSVATPMFANLTLQKLSCTRRDEKGLDLIY